MLGWIVVPLEPPLLGLPLTQLGLLLQRPFVLKVIYVPVSHLTFREAVNNFLGMH